MLAQISISLSNESNVDEVLANYPADAIEALTYFAGMFGPEIKYGGFAADLPKPIPEQVETARKWLRSRGYMEEGYGDS